MCSLFILGTALTIATGAYVRAAAGERDAAFRLAALGIAEREMERLKALPFEQLPAQGVAAPAWQGVKQLPHGRAALRVGPGEPAGMKKIVLRVEWRQDRGPLHAVELTALRSPRGG